MVKLSSLKGNKQATKNKDSFLIEVNREKGNSGQTFLIYILQMRNKPSVFRPTKNTFSISCKTNNIVTLKVVIQLNHTRSDKYYMTTYYSTYNQVEKVKIQIQRKVLFFCLFFLELFSDFI